MQMMMYAMGYPDGSINMPPTGGWRRHTDLPSCISNQVILGLQAGHEPFVLATDNLS